ncbi:MAG: glycyl-tRNA synthetase subunit beta [Betaproteobacteria bacterium]|nr:glycyl-tRNA synthetase subunit beta [Betaproteobacteria bacterium]
MKANLLVELFTEELPPKALKRLGDAFGHAIAAGLAARGLTDKGDAPTVYATPRRLGVKIADVVERAPDRVERKKLMPAKVAYGADGTPTAALMKRLEKDGGTVDQLERKIEGNAEYVFLNQVVPGASLQTALQMALEDAIAKLPIPKVMGYQLADGATTVHFVRPAHGIIALHGANVVAVSALGLKADRIAHGHRFQGVKDIPIATADAYEEALAAHGNVVASFDERRAGVARQLAAKAEELGASLGDESAYAPLLDEVTALVEQATVYVGEFEAEFLAVPAECLVLTMRQNQKYFPLFDKAGRLVNKFLIVSNMRLAEPRNIIEGNERVVRPRLADARFFFETDKKTRLEARVPLLAKVTYHNKLGSQLERGERVQLLAGRIAHSLGADTALAERAAWLAKADLITGMVGEFPELQGTMGRYYALADGENTSVADAIEQHYRPRFAGDALPGDNVAISLALADKLETLCGFFSIGQQPTGDKDPFALRRHALGVIRILIEKNLPVSVHDLVTQGFASFAKNMPGDAHADLQTFLLERLRSYLRDGGYTANEVESVLSKQPTRFDQVPLQLAAVRAFASLPEAASLAAANKRVANILKQAEGKGETVSQAEAVKLKEPAERELFQAIATAVKQATPLFEKGDYTGYLKAFAILKTPVDSFFDSVMVMADDLDLRRNRLALLSDLRLSMNRVADISKLAA